MEVFSATFNRKDLETAVALCMPAVSTTNQLEIIKGIRLTVHDMGKRVSFTAFDMSKGVITTTDAIAEGSGSIVIPGAKLLQAVRNLTGDTVTITAADNGKCNIKSGKSRVTVPFLDGSGFPNTPMLAGDGDFSFSKEELTDSMKKAVYAAAKGNARADLNGVLFNIKQDGSQITMELVGTDSFRISRITKIFSCDGKSKPQSGKAIVPTEVVQAFVKMLDASQSETVRLLTTSKHLILLTNEFTFFTRLIDGQFMDVDKIIGNFLNQQTEVTVSTEELHGALQRATLITEERQIASVKPYVRLETDNGVLKITTEAATGSTYDEVEADITEGSPAVAIGFNNTYLMDAVKAIYTEKCVIQITNATRAALVRPLLTTDSEREQMAAREKNGLVSEDQLNLVMPVRMKN